MNIGLDLHLQLPASGQQRLRQLQAEFAAACNLLAPIAQAHRCWNRVALHHLAYRTVRDQLPQLGSQMACNAIYAVSRACRIVYQGPSSPFNIRTRSGARLPLLKFLPDAPVYFDSHTLRLSDGQVSVFTLEGRLHCGISPTIQQQQHLAKDKVREIALYSRDGSYKLSFKLATAAHAVVQPSAQRASYDELAEHIQVRSTVAADPVPAHNTLRSLDT
jgi:hypothetical protein